MPPELLVSVQDFSEFQLAIEAGVNWVDLKDPKRGSLGRPGGDVICQIANYFVGFSSRTFKTSLALGEITDLELEQLEPEVTWFDFAKVALAGYQTNNSRDKLHQLSNTMQRPEQLILVHYADYQIASAPTFSQVLELACELNCRYLLIDTYRKSAGNLFHWYESPKLTELVQQARSNNVAISLAGSLGIDDLQEAAKCRPDVLAVRGAACEVGNRTNGLSSRRLAELVELASCGFEGDVSIERPTTSFQLRVT